MGRGEPGAVVFETERGNLDASVETQLREIERGPGGPYAEGTRREQPDLARAAYLAELERLLRCAGPARSRKSSACWWNRAGPRVAIGDFCEDAAPAAGASARR